MCNKTSMNLISEHYFSNTKEKSLYTITTNIKVVEKRVIKCAYKVVKYLFFLAREDTFIL